MKASDRLKLAVSALESACRAIVNEKRAPVDKQIGILQSLKFDAPNEASRLVAEAMTSPDPMPLLLQAAEALAGQDRTDTAASLRGTAVDSLRRKVDGFEADMKPVTRVQQFVGPVIEMATKAVMSRTVGAGGDYLASTIERHLSGNVEAALKAVADVKGSFCDPRVDQAAEGAAEAFSGILDMVLESEGI